MAQTRKRLKTAVFESVLFNSDILVAIGPFLAAEDFTNLASTSRHFGGRTTTDPHANDNANDNATEQNLSLMEKIARQVIKKEQTGQERAALPRYPGESWIALYHQLVLLRKPIIFDRLVGLFAQYVDRDKSRVTSASMNCTMSAISDQVMRAGKHYVEVSNRSRFGRAGIMRPVANNCFTNHPQKLSSESFSPTYLDEFISPKFLGERNERWGDSNVHGCQCSFSTGHCYWSNWRPFEHAANSSWDGRESVSRQTQNSVLGILAGNVTLGLLLDLDEGTLSVYKNGRRLGTMMSGLSGEYCWVVSMRQGTRYDELSIRRASIPEDA